MTFGIFYAITRDKMLSIFLLSTLALNCLGLPTDRQESFSLLPREDIADNSVDVDEKVQKVGRAQIGSSTPLGSQFAVAHTHPERKGLVTGHRIPLGLFPLETQARILELDNIPEATDVASDKYVDTSSFRRPARLAVVALPPRFLTPPSRALRVVLKTLPFGSSLSPPSKKLRVPAISATALSPPSKTLKVISKTLASGSGLSPPSQKLKVPAVSANALSPPSKALKTAPTSATGLSPPREVPFSSTTTSPPLPDFIPQRERLQFDNSLSAFGHPSELSFQEREGDKTYERSLHTFLPPSFF